MAPPSCEKIREMPHKHQTETTTHILDQITTNQERNQQLCKMTLILLLPASRHDKHDSTHIKTKHTTHPAPGDISTTTQLSSRSTAAPISSLPLPPPFCSAMIVVAPLLRCASQSAAAALGLAALSYQPSIHHFPTRSTHHLPINITTPGFTAECCWLWFFYRESLATTHHICRRRRTRCLR